MLLLLKISRNKDNISIMMKNYLEIIINKNLIYL